jgi:dienelactone hydrolase
MLPLASYNTATSKDGRYGYHEGVMLSRTLSTLFVYPLAAAFLAAQTAQDPAAVAKKALDLLLAKKYSELQPMFARAYREAATEQQLSKIGVQPAWGAVESIGNPSVGDMGPIKVITIPVKFAAQTRNFVAYINPSNEIGQLGFREAETPWQHPPYAKLDSFKERDVTVGEGDWKLSGTLTVPVGKGPFPAVVLVHGSGARDRDDTAFANKAFKDLAEGLASRGIVVIRYEKRLRQYQSRMSSKSYTLDEDISEDAAKAASLLRSQPEVNPAKVYVLGYELGGYAAPRIAEADGKLAGIVLFAANERPLEDLFVDQAVATNKPAQYLTGIKVAAARIKKLDQGDADGPPLLGFPVAYWLDLRSYDPGPLVKDFSGHVLVLAAERDFQVPMTDFAAWKKALEGRKDTTFKSYPTLNHLFIAGAGPSNEDEYKKPGHVSPDVIDDLAKFLSQ